MIEREIRSDKEYIRGFHTQESRSRVLDESLECGQENAWLGIGHYFWLEEKFAHYWGQDSKRNTGKYDIYTAWIHSGRLINATFNEEGYYFWKSRIEKAMDQLKKLGFELDLKLVHEYLAERVWPEFDIRGIIFDDLPHNPRGKDRTYSEIAPLYYEKRLQLVIFDVSTATDFQIFKRGLNCTQTER